MTYPCNTDEVHQVPQWRTHVHPVAHNLLNGVHVSTQDAKVWKEYVALFALSRTENSAKKINSFFHHQSASTSCHFLYYLKNLKVHTLLWRDHQTVPLAPIPTKHKLLHGGQVKHSCFWSMVGIKWPKNAHLLSSFWFLTPGTSNFA